MKAMACLCLCLSPAAYGQDFQKTERKITIKSPSLKEASGLAVSSRNPDFLWLINDSGAPPLLHLCDVKGNERGVVSVKGARNVDWEDIASFSMNGENFLLIADTGDNVSKRDGCTLYLIEEPTLPAPGSNLTMETTPRLTISFTYEDGPRDCESVAVDVCSQEILLLSKRTTPPALYQLPLPLRGNDPTLMARKICSMEVNAPPSASPVSFGNQPTGMALTPEGTMAAVVTYYGVFLFPKAKQESWKDAFSRKPQILAPHQLPQAEAIGLAKDGKTIFVTSEGNNPELVTYQR